MRLREPRGRPRRRTSSESSSSTRLPTVWGPRRQRGVSPFKVRLGRTPVAGRSPGDAPPLYGEVGIDVDSGTGLSLVPSFRVVLPNDDETAASEAAATQILKLGAKIRF